MPEISDADLATLQKTRALMESLYADKSHGLAFKKMVKAKMPDANIPELDIGEAIAAPIREELTEAKTQVSALTERLDKMQKERDDADLDGKFRKSMDAAKKRFGMTDDGMSKVMDLMRERQIADPMAGAALYLQDLPPAPAKAPRYLPENMNMFGIEGDATDARTKLLHTNPQRFFDQEVAAVMNDPASALPA